MSQTSIQTDKKPDLTKLALVAMLTENTGRNMLDSGGVYGRHWEQNQGVDFDAKPAVTFRGVVTACNDGQRRYDIETSYDVYHWLCQRVTFDPKMDRRYQAFANRRRSEESELKVMEAFPAALRDKGRHVTGLHGEEVAEFSATNTYNGEDALSQILQYVYFEVDGDPFVALQIHGGCDARGGYTKAKVFRIDSDDPVSFFDNNKVTLVGRRPKEAIPQMDVIYWESDNAGYSFRCQRDGMPGPVLDLMSYGLEGEPDRGFPFSIDPIKRGMGVVVIDPETGDVYCPVTGWKLEMV